MKEADILQNELENLKEQNVRLREILDHDLISPMYILGVLSLMALSFIFGMLLNHIIG